MNNQTVTVAEILSAARARQASLVAESAGHVVLSLARPLSGAPLWVDPATIVLSPEGNVALRGAGRATDEPASTAQLRGLLRCLLAASTGAPGPLEAVARPRERERSQQELFAELATALIPINRAAAKRALARLARETLRAKANGQLRGEPPTQAPQPAEPDATARPPAAPEASPPADAAASPFATPPPSRCAGPAAPKPPAALHLCPQPDGARTPTPTPPPCDRPSGVGPIETELREVVCPASTLIATSEERADDAPLSVVLETPGERRDTLDAISVDFRAAAPTAGAPRALTPKPTQAIVREQGETAGSHAGDDVRAADRSGPGAEAEAQALEATGAPQRAADSVGAARTDRDDEPSDEAGGAGSQKGTAGESADPSNGPTLDDAALETAFAMDDDYWARAEIDGSEPLRAVVLVGESSCAAASPAEPDADDDEPEPDSSEWTRPLPLELMLAGLPHTTAAATTAPEQAEAPRADARAPTAPPPVEVRGAEDDAIDELAEPVPPTVPDGVPFDTDAAENEDEPAEIAVVAPSLAWTDAPYEVAPGPPSTRRVTVDLPIALDAEEEYEVELARDASEAGTAVDARKTPAEMVAEVDWSDGPAPIGPTAAPEPAIARQAPTTAVPEEALQREPGATTPPRATPADEPEPPPEPETALLPVATPGAEPEPGPDRASPTGLAAEPEPLDERHPAPYRTVESLLDEFGDQDGVRSRALLEAARSLKHLAQVATPTPPALQFDRLDEELAPPASPVAGLTVGLESAEVAAIPPPSLEPTPLRRPRATLWTSAALLVVGLASVGALWVKKPELFVGSHSPLARAPWAAAPDAASPGAPSSPGDRTVMVTLRELPGAHEVLLRMGVAPMRTPRVPSATRLEFVATAPGHRAARIVVPADAAWSTDTSGARHLALRTALEPGPTTQWPVAPMGTSGGVGPAGRIEFAATPPGTEIWLVLHAGSEPEVRVPVALDEGAHLMVVDLRRPEAPCRLTLGSSELRAAAEQDGLATSCPSSSP